jgi:glycopeptide antibiotics resistance protein
MRISGWLKVAVIALFLTYLVLLVWVVMWKLHEPFIGRDDMREIKLVPFATSSIYGASAPIEVLQNIAVFVPLGIYLGMLKPAWRWWTIVLIAAVLSLGFEVAQYLTAAGSSDTTDLIANTTGALLGFGVLVVARRALRHRVVPVVTWSLALGTVVAIGIAAVVIGSFPQLPAPSV